MHTELGKAPKISQEDSLQAVARREKKEPLEIDKVPQIGHTFPVDSWISEISFKQFYYLNSDYSSIETLKVPGYLKNRVKLDTEYDGNTHYFCIDFLKQALKNAEFFEGIVENERNQKHIKKRRDELKKEMWLNLANKFQAEFQRIKHASSSK